MRYIRQTDMPEWGLERQLALKRSSVLVIGAGALGSAASFYLAAAGVGNLGIADGDKVELSNLQRQIAHTTARIGILKADSMARSVSALNPEVQIEVIPHFVDAGNIPDIISPYDFVIDATDSFSAKRLINDCCVESGKPLCHGAVWRLQGQLMTILPHTACYSCLFPTDPEPLTGARGPLGTVPGIIGTLQATEALKYLTDTGELLTDTLLRYDAASADFDKIRVGINPSCPHHHNKKE